MSLQERKEVQALLRARVGAEGSGFRSCWSTPSVSTRSGALATERTGRTRYATILYMTTVGVAELRQNLSRYLRRVEKGDRLIAEGRVTRPLRRGLPEPLQLGGDVSVLSRALDEIRGER